MEFKKTLIISVIIIILMFSCKKETKRDKSDGKITLVFPDTVYLNEIYDNGRIDYKNRLDTITTRLDDQKKARFIDYVFLITKEKKYSMNSLKTIMRDKDTAYADNNRLIPLYNIRFNKLGLNYFDGIITDEVIIENGAKGKKGKPMTRIITDEIRLTRGVYVIERPKSRIKNRALLPHESSSAKSKQLKNKVSNTYSIPRSDISPLPPESLRVANSKSKVPALRGLSRR